MTKLKESNGFRIKVQQNKSFIYALAITLYYCDHKSNSELEGLFHCELFEAGETNIIKHVLKTGYAMD